MSGELIALSVVSGGVGGFMLAYIVHLRRMQRLDKVIIEHLEAITDSLRGIVGSKQRSMDLLEAALATKEAKEQ